MYDIPIKILDKIHMLMYNNIYVGVTKKCRGCGGEVALKIIGLCGASGSGKSTVASIFEKHGVFVLDADRVYADLVDAPSPCLTELAQRFGAQILNDRGALDRKRLAQLVFLSPDSESKRRSLNEIAHRHILAEVRRRIARLEARGAKIVLFDAPLLFESGFDAECDRVVSVVADREVKIARILRRDGIDRTMAERRIDAQLSDEVLARRSDFCIINNGDLRSVEDEVLKIINEINEVKKG